MEMSNRLIQTLFFGEDHQIFKNGPLLDAEVRLVQGMYKGTKGRVLVGSRMSEFSVNIGLRQGSALSPLMFIMVMELISRKVSFEGWYGEDVVCGRSGCCGGEWAGNAGSTGGVEGGFWEA